MKVNYYINNVSLDSLNVSVSSSKGLLSLPGLKDPVTMSWPDENGEHVDLSNPRYESREITLNCFIRAASATLFTAAVATLFDALTDDDLVQLRVDADDGVVTRKQLVYMVYLKEGIDIEKRWRDGTMVGTFSMRLVEPEPVKRIYRYVAVAGAMSLSLAVTSGGPVNVYWGDGVSGKDIKTSSGEVSHLYATEGVFFIVVTGVIEDVAINTLATTIWNRL